MFKKLLSCSALGLLLLLSNSSGNSVSRDNGVRNAPAGFNPGPDIITGDIQDLEQYGNDGTQVGLGVSTTSCNAGCFTVRNTRSTAVSNSDNERASGACGGSALGVRSVGPMGLRSALSRGRSVALRARAVPSFSRSLRSRSARRPLPPSVRRPAEHPSKASPAGRRIESSAGKTWPARRGWDRH